MQEITPTSLEYIKQQETVEKANIFDFMSFEDEIAMSIVPNMDDSQIDYWSSRIKISELLKPIDFNGKIINIVLHPILDPYQRIVDAIENDEPFIKCSRSKRTLRSTKASIAIQTNEFSEETEETSLGFMLTADMKSSCGGIIGKVEAELFYLQILKDKLPDQDRKKRNAKTPAVQRYVSKPKIERKKMPRKSNVSTAAALGNSAIKIVTMKDKDINQI